MNEKIHFGSPCFNLSKKFPLYRAVWISFDFRGKYFYRKAGNGMKKIMLIVLGIAIMASITSCGNGAEKAAAVKGVQESQAEKDTQENQEELAEIWRSASEKTAALRSIDVDYTMDTILQVGDEEGKTQAGTELRINHFAQEDMQCSWNTNMETAGQALEMITFYDDGYYYMALPDKKIKCVLSPEQMKDQVEAKLYQWVLDSDWFTGLHAEEEAGGRVIRFTGEEEKVKEYLKRTMEQRKSNMANMEMELEKSTGEIVVNAEGYIERQLLEVEMKLLAGGAGAKVSMRMELIYHNPGQPVSIEFPSTDDFAEVDTEALLNSM